MIPRLHPSATTNQVFLDFLADLKRSKFAGDIDHQYSQRTVLATDNSIYQMLPQAVLFPKNKQDIAIAANIANQTKYAKITFGPRGGGTGTNGQSLTDGIVMDLSKHMNGILEINAEKGYALVQTGVVKDQLNAALKPHGLFFAPELSTSNRATIGGMISTDASGQGSVMYGKTRDHVLNLETVLLDGSILKTGPIDDQLLQQKMEQGDLEASIYQTIDLIEKTKANLIKEKFPPLNRCLTGYDLAHIRDDNNQLNLNNILCGSEGTLGFIVEAKLNVLPIPKFSALVNVCYESFENSMRDAQTIMRQKPASIETVDSRVLGLAKADIVWHNVKQYFPEVAGKNIEGINFVEYTSDSEIELTQKVESLVELLSAQQGSKGKNIAIATVFGSSEVNKIWGMRKKAVGLLGNGTGKARPLPFVEDTAVPPENLADFIMEFRKVLDDNQLTYGMFGHVDAGVLHVRPSIDMQDIEQAKLIRTVTNQVVELVKKYNGLLWGEHGKGVRSEFSPEFFGELFPALQEIKAVFDPLNRINPGKIATPNDDVQLLKIDQVPTRGDYDRKVSDNNWQQYKEVLYCNGNGACYNWDHSDFMCPSYKATRDRRDSPKGRSSLIREWLRLADEKSLDTALISQKIKGSIPGLNFLKKSLNTVFSGKKEQDFNHEVMQAMSTCLACKSCAAQCPIKVDIPEARAKFYQLYYSRYLRPIKDYLIGASDFYVPMVAPFAPVYNFFMKQNWINGLMAKYAGMVDSPLISKNSLKKGMKRLDIKLASQNNLRKLDEEAKQKTVVLVQDAFTTYFDADAVVNTLETIKKLGFNPMVMPYSPNGKGLHVHGFFSMFERVAKGSLLKLKTIEQFGLPMIGLDPSMTLTYRNEYKKTLPGESIPQVMLMQEWLAPALKNHKVEASVKDNADVYLLAHCTEATNAASSVGQWQEIYQALGIKLTLLKAGCCGMAGTFGHETKNKALSQSIYQLSWAEHVQNKDINERLVATGYSCRSQAKREDQQKIQHPLAFLSERLVNNN